MQLLSQQDYVCKARHTTYITAVCRTKTQDRWALTQDPILLTTGTIKAESEGIPQCCFHIGSQLGESQHGP